MFTTLHTLLLLLGLERVLRSQDSQPRVWGCILIMTATLGSALMHYQLSRTEWVMGSMLYVIIFLAGLALSPLQLLLVFWSKPRNEVSTGMFEVYKPKAAEDVGVDIIAVHGLGSDPSWAWTYWERRSGVEVSNNVMWLRDLLPDALPGVRIMTFNHDSAWRSDAPVKSVQDCANQLLDAVRTCRNSDEEKKRRIIFIGHSFGGIIIKKALVTAGEKSSEARYKSLSDSVLGALFLGVPHDGSRLTKAGVFVSYITYCLGSSTELLEALRPGTEALWVLNDAFLKGYGTSEYHVVNFCETRKTQKWGVPLLLAVDKKASSMPGKTNVSLECDHMRMNKFKSETDGNYKLVLNEVKEMVERVQEAHAATVTKEMEECLSTIFFKELDDRLNAVSDADASTFEWIWTDDRMTNWQDASPGILWVIGKPGSGKSTLCKYLFDRKSKEAESLPSKIVARFFFNARGASLAQSLRGLLQALLYQALRKLPATYTYILPEYRKIRGKLENKGEWPLKVLLDTFLQIIEDPAVKSLHLFIDALDECVALDYTTQPSGEDALTREYLSMIFSAARSNPSFKIFVTSRHQLFPGILDVGYIQITLESMTADDIETFLEGRIVAIPTENRTFVQAELMARASGVFLWVKLVLEELIHECAQVSEEELKQILISIPNQLESLYARMLERLIAKLKAPQCLETRYMFAWVSLAERPLTVAEFRYAIALSQHTFASTHSFETSGKVQRLDQTAERIKSRSGGLLEIEVQSNTVQFIHQSAKEFCHNSKFPQQFHFTVSDAHLRMATICTAYLCWPELQSISIDDVPYARIPEEISFIQPFLNYAVLWFVHAELAKASGNPFLEDLWKLASSGSSSLLPKSPLIFAVQANMPHFMTYLLDRGMDVNSLGRRYESALQTAAHMGRVDIVKLLINRGADVNIQDGLHANALQIAAYSRQTEMTQLLLDNGADPNLRSRIYGSTLHAAANVGDVPLVKLLLDRGADINSRGGYCNTTVLQSAVTAESAEKMVRVLLDRGADVNQKGGSDGDALCAAVRGSHDCEKVVRLLLESGARIDGQGGDSEWGSALHSVAYWGRKRVAELLLDSGADVNGQSGKYGTVLQAAANGSGGKEMLELLLSRGANINAEGGEYGTALQAAATASENNEEMVRMLLERGADVNVAGGLYGNALQAAAYRGHVKVVQLLLENGANINAEGGKYGTALQAAATASGDNEGIVRMLLERGADVNVAGGEYGNALQAAAYRGHVKVVELLLENGANINAEGGEYGTALQAAATGFRDNERIVRMLLERGADVNVAGGVYGNALQAAASRGHVKVVELLLENGANINAEGGEYGTALYAAATASENNEEMVRMLLERGADVNVAGGLCGNALQAAASRGHVKVVQLLLENGANINGEGGYYGTALQAAATPVYGANKEIVRMLMERGADVNAAGGPYGNALQAAVKSESEEVVKLLLDRGADVNARGGQFETALMAAAYRKNEEILIRLLEEGADVNVPGDFCGNALYTASKFGMENAVELLLKKGADVNAQGGKLCNALQVAAFGGHMAVVELLLNAGADINAQGGYYGSALQAAASTDSGKKALELLLARGAEVNIQGGRYGTALQAAAQAGGHSLVLLLDKSADVNIRGGLYETALQAAAQRMNGENFVKLLLDRGADVNVQGGKYGNALQAAAWRGNEKAVELLLAAGADASMGFRVGGMDDDDDDEDDDDEDDDDDDEDDDDDDDDDDEYSFGSALEAAEEAGHEAVAEMIREALRS